MQIFEVKLFLVNIITRGFLQLYVFVLFKRARLKTNIAYICFRSVFGLLK